MTRKHFADAEAFENSLPGWPETIPPGHWVYSKASDNSEPNAMLGECDGKPIWFKFVVMPMRPLSQFEIDFCTGDPKTCD